MRRQEKEITDIHRIEEIIGQAAVCRLGLYMDGRVYIVPMNFGYQDRKLYFHSAKAGRKIDILKSNPEVCFEVDLDLGIKQGNIACQWGARYKSIIGYGKAAFLRETASKKKALDIIMRHYSFAETHNYSEASLENTAVFVVDIEEISGKESN